MITILTNPVPAHGPCWFDALGHFSRDVKNRISAFAFGDRPQRGPAGVVRSLLRGLSDLGIQFNYNPPADHTVGDIAVVLSDVNALRQALIWKQRKIISRLLAGPNLMVRSNEHGGILASPEVDVCLVPSDWVRTAYEEDMPALRNRIHTWYAGVDVDFWSPTNRSHDRHGVLVYWKTESEMFCREVTSCLTRHNWRPTVLKYGSYKSTQFRSALTRAKFAVFLSRSESQGIALAEAWSMDVPTLVWQSGQLAIEGRAYSTFSSCPYLTPSTGASWSSLAQLSELLVNLNTLFPCWHPRQWVRNNMTDDISARKLAGLCHTTPSP